MTSYLTFLLGLVVFVTNIISPCYANTTKSHAITLYDEPPKYAAGFQHFDYVNPQAPKGGVFRVAPPQEVSFDSFHPYIAKGAAVATGSVETLMVASADEPFTHYGLIAQSIEWPKDRSWAIFHLNPKAKWHDGLPILADDVIWTFNTLMEKGHPQYRFYYSSVEKVEKLDDLRVKFIFNEANNRELPMIAGQLPVLPKHYWQGRDFTKTTLEPPLGSGPYKIKTFEAGRYIVQERVKDYWGKDLPVRVGLNNFDELRTDFYRDITAARLALKSGKVDFFDEHQAKAWALEYDVEVVTKGWLVKERISHQLPQGMQGAFLNTRREILSDPRVREAIGYAFDFEWTNKNLFFNQYTRSNSFFSNSPLAATGLPTGQELQILSRFKEQLPDKIFTQALSVPSTDGSGWARDNLRQAFDLLKQAGWTVKNQRLVNAQGQPFEFEILLISKGMERIMLPWVRNLKRLGMEVKVRLVDTAQYINRLRAFEFDAFILRQGQSDSPGNEQSDLWTTKAASTSGSRNYAGISDPVIDTLIDELIKAPDRETLIAYTKALDRLLLHGHYVVPNWYLAADRLLYWNKFSRPNVPLKDGSMTSRWWFDEGKAEELRIARGKSKPADGSLGNQSASRPWWALFMVLLVGGWMLKRYFSNTQGKGQ